MSKQHAPNHQRALERRKIMLISTSVAAISAGMIPLSQKHPQVITVWLCFLGIAFVYVAAQLVRIKRKKR